MFLGPIEDDVDRPAVQARSTNATTPTVSTQAMKIILEEDENSESPPTEYELNRYLNKKINKYVFLLSSKSGATIQPVGNLPKLNKIIESGT